MEIRQERLNETVLIFHLPEYVDGGEEARDRLFSRQDLDAASTELPGELSPELEEDAQRLDTLHEL